MDLNDLERMGRRRFMENLAGIGVSATTLNYLEQDELADITHDPEEEVPYVERIEIVNKEPGQPPEKEPVYNTINREEWERRSAAINIRDDLYEWAQNELEGDISTSFGKLQHSPTDFGVQLYVPKNSSLPVEKLEQILPTETNARVQGKTYEDIPISINEAVSTPQCDYQKRDSDTIPRGDMLRSDIGEFTAMGTFHSDEYGDGLATAGHVMEEGMMIAKNEPNDQNPWIGNARDVVDDTTDDNIKYRDCGFIEVENGYSVMDAITGSDNSYIEFTIEGYHTDESLNAHAGEETLEANYQGRSTCRHQGYIEEVSQNEEVVLVGLDEETQDGDSGGPYFDDATTTEAYMIGSHNGIHTDAFFNKYATATTPETIEDSLGGHIF